MNMYRSPSRKCQGVAEQDDKGFTLIEILIAIVLVGILSAVAVIGISNLTKQGGNSACTATKDAATAASVVYFTSSNPSTYPINFTQLTTGTPPALTQGSLIIGSPTPAVPATTGTLLSSGTSWTLTMTKGGAIAPDFACSTP